MTSGLEIFQIPLLKDNYSYVLRTADHHIAVVDPSEADPILAFLQERQWPLHTILLTHHHHDHIGGAPGLKTYGNPRIVASTYDAHRIPADIRVQAGDKIKLGSHLTADVLFTPGHTTGHICYWLSDSQALFCGDTLFTGGCGRLFEGTPEMMWASLQQLMTLPPTTQVYCAHEYTSGNLQFALSLEPDLPQLVQRSHHVSDLRRLGHSTVPSTLELELATNPFLRVPTQSLRKALGTSFATVPDVEVFAELRRRKDRA